MPFKSEAQKRYMFAKHPEIAKRWESEYPSQGKLPERVAKKPKLSWEKMTKIPSIPKMKTLK